ncbi:hypothetical protein ACFO25_06560 [Paenactinomyces guangxiensis]|uniref:Uncharacterized protein n=1 Tax=Paenactinomyces guangxiensis TaxID=1490290 RepID=A0A7W1WNR4_9BACL|nr:hypothetical protein [Paenactinomyces guangxiensis]MBA4493287.1 hypothetical protein [Paenactinomyces guangxiensis]MBH8589862.1 hypothetical protein [Paenactinomyces guangxiensis]
MQLKSKALTGIVRPYQTIDRMLKSQGFRRCHNQPPVYNMQIKDMVSGMTYCLKIPTTPGTNPEYLRLESPSLELQTSFNKHSYTPMIPDSVVSAVHHKMEEVASYLRS